MLGLNTYFNITVVLYKPTRFLNKFVFYLI